MEMKTFMKKYKFAAIISFVFLILISGCSLDEDLPSDLRQKDIKTKEDLDNLIKGAYSEFNDGSAFKMWGQMMIQLCADDMYATKGQWQSYGMKVIDGVNTQQMWNTMYRIIRNATYVIKVSNTLDIDREYQKKAVGEASFIRALAYYYLVRLYGGVPLRVEAVDLESDFFLPRSSVDEIYEQIFYDLTVANSTLPLANKIAATDLGRASKGAAQAIMASARLTYGNYLENKGKTGYEEQYKQAVNWSDSIIQKQVPSVYSLTKNYADLWDVSKEVAAYNEVIFGIRFTRDPSKTQLASSGSELAFRFLPDNISGLTGQIANPPNKNGKGENNILMHPYFYTYYFTHPQYSTANITDNDEDADYRLESSFFTRWTNEDNGRYIIACPRNVPNNLSNDPGTKNQVYLRKYVDGEGKDQRNHENDFFIIRLSEIYLIKAEALNELYGPTAEALASFNELRKRARNGDGTARTYPLDLTNTDVTNKTDMRMQIFDERGLEFVGEGLRWFDLVRMKHPTIAGKTMHDYRFTLLKDQTRYSRTNPSYDKAGNVWSNTNAVSYAYVSTISDYIDTNNKFLLFPIPLSEMDNNPNINSSDQNPGW